MRRAAGAPPPTRRRSTARCASGAAKRGSSRACASSARGRTTCMAGLRKPRVGLALGAGGARGWAHIGVIRALQAAGIEAQVVCGASMGALIGSAYAGGTLERIEGWAQTLGWRDVLGLMDFTWRGGLIRGEKLFDFFRASAEDRDIADLPVL